MVFWYGQTLEQQEKFSLCKSDLWQELLQRFFILVEEDSHLYQ